MSKFKVGDRVKCIERFGGYLTPGVVYTVEGVGQDTVNILIVDDKGNLRYFHTNRFIQVDPREELEAEIARLQAKLDALPKKFRYERWVNVYPGKLGTLLFPSAEQAGEGYDRTRVACIRVTVEGTEGDGLE